MGFNKEIIPIVAAGIATIGVVTAAIVAFFTARHNNKATLEREAFTFRRQQHKDKLAETRALYEDIVFGVGKLVSNGAYSSDDEVDFLSRKGAKLALVAPNDLQEQFVVAADAINTWLPVNRAANPERRDGYMIISSKQSLHTEQAEELHRNVNKEIGVLNKMMKDHLQELEQAA